MPNYPGRNYDYLNERGAKRTKYKNKIFRSKLEATWASFFYHCDIEYQYEDYPPIYTNQFGGYLPDFRISLNGMPTWVEIKPEIIQDPRLFKMLEQASLESNSSIMLLDGYPSTKTYARYQPFVWKSLTLSDISEKYMHAVAICKNDPEIQIIFDSSRGISSAQSDFC